MKIAVLGAGSIGCFVGGRLLAAGTGLRLVGRARSEREIKHHGLTLRDIAGNETVVPGGSVDFATNAASLKGFDMILLCVKSGDTQSAAADIGRNSGSDAVVVSLQNGVGNQALLKKELPRHRVYGGMVPFNVVHSNGGHFHQTTSGTIVLEEGPETKELAGLLEAAGISCETSRAIESVMWGKLCLNLNNAINVLSGIPLKQQLETRAYRLVLARCVHEALAVAKARGIQPAAIGKASPSLIPLILSLPTFLFRLVASAMLRIDPLARSSMWEDLERKRKSEIDHLNGEVVRLGEISRVPTPANEVVTRLVREAFRTGTSPQISGPALLGLISNNPSD